MYRSLKSGSDIRGTAIGDNADLTDEAVGAIADAFAVWLGTMRSNFACLQGQDPRGDVFDKPLKVAVGHDSRLSAPRLKKVLLDRLVKAGAKVYDCGLCSTPAMYMMTRYPETDCDAAIMITASHHPKDKNGLKFFVKSGGLEGADITEILELAEKSARVIKTGGEVITKVETSINSVMDKQNCPRPSPQSIIEGDFLGLYCNDLISKMPSLKGLKIAVDAGNGAGGFFAQRILSPLGADISGSQFLDPDGNFPNHAPNPEDAAAMRSISNRVKATGADLGIIFDTDVDRVAIVSASGEEINRNKLIALISAILLEEEKGAKIVTDSVTSAGLKDFIEERGGVHYRFKRGYKNVINEAKRLNAPLAIETSGHAALRENYYLDDGAYLVARILKKMAQCGDVTKLIADLKVPAEEKEIRIGATAQVIDRLTRYAKEHLIIAPDNHEGIRVTVPHAQGWFLARMSVHDPVMVINIESDMTGGVDIIEKILEPLIRRPL